MTFGQRSVNKYVHMRGKNNPSQEEIANVKVLEEMARNPIRLEQKRRERVMEDAVKRY